MATTTKAADDHLELRRKAKEAVGGGTSPMDRLDEIRDRFDAVVELAHTADRIDHARKHGGAARSGDADRWRLFERLSPMSLRVASSIFAHDRELEELWELINERVCKLEYALDCTLEGALLHDEGKREVLDMIHNMPQSDEEEDS
jgi:hypothetical protein